MLLKTKDRWTAVHALINTLLKDKVKYCNYCGTNYSPTAEEACCEYPQIGTHSDHLRGVIAENKIIRGSRENDLATTQDGSMRWGISLPPRFLSDLEKSFKSTQGEKLLRNNSDLHKFMKKFPAFATCKKV